MPVTLIHTKSSSGFSVSVHLVFRYNSFSFYLVFKERKYRKKSELQKSSLLFMYLHCSSSIKQNQYLISASIKFNIYSQLFFKTCILQVAGSSSDLRSSLKGKVQFYLCQSARKLLSRLQMISNNMQNTNHSFNLTKSKAYKIGGNKRALFQKFLFLILLSLFTDHLCRTLLSD